MKNTDKNKEKKNDKKDDKFVEVLTDVGAFISGTVEIAARVLDYILDNM